MKVAIASKNPVKVNAVEKIFKEFFQEEIKIITSESDPKIPPQPKSEKETIDCVTRRINFIKKQIPEVDFWVGIEAGIEKKRVFSWILIQSKEKTGKARTATFELPKKISDILENHAELGNAADYHFKKQKLKQQGGIIGELTQGKITRQKIYEQAISLALIPFINNNS